METQLIEDFITLELEYGNQQRVANALGITLRHYSRVKCGHHPGSEQLIKHVQALAKQAEAKKLMQ